jgi:hypothetical protein
MKKPLFILFIAVFLGACQGEFDDVTYTITNDSSKPVSFSFNGISKNFNKGDSITYTINSGKGRIIPKNVTFSGHIRNVSLITLNKGTSGIFYTFSDNNPLPLNVKNTLTTPITIKADDFIGASGDTGSAFNAEQYTLTIPNNNTVVKALIYTSFPNFTLITPPAPKPVIDWKLENNTINVTIK